MSHEATDEFRSKLMVLVLPLRWNLFFKIFTGFRPRKLCGSFFFAEACGSITSDVFFGVHQA